MFCLYALMITQIVLESFPVSSSGHMRLLDYFCSGLEVPGHLHEFFIYALHFPTACVVMLFFRREWSFPFLHFRRCYFLIAKISLFTAIATTITIFAYFIKHQFKVITIPLFVGFFITACVLYYIRGHHIQHFQKLSLQKVIGLACLQVCALVPGISRFACTFVGACTMAIPERRAFEISFLIEWPITVCAGIYGIYILWRSDFQLLNPGFIFVMLCSSCVAYAGLYVQRYLIYKKSMWIWSVYMIFPIVLAFLAGGFNG